ncbi:MAG: ricin-type beta-trefoil lectin domain protein [Acidobacteriia bacterium]|nr:ricin-type beta-trefoil lectin domain protein [Terriglobia bacterium]
MVMLAVNNEGICKLGVNTRLSCKDETTIDLQIEAAKRLERELLEDGGWFKIVYTPGETRQAVQEGKLAVVLGIEVDTPLGCGTGTIGQLGGFGEDSPPTDNSAAFICGVAKYRCSTTINVRDCSRLSCGRRASCGAAWGMAEQAKLDALYAKGVRHFFPVHFIENGFGGPSLFDENFALSQYYINGELFEEMSCREIDPNAMEIFRFKDELGKNWFGQVALAALALPYPTYDAAKSSWPAGGGSCQAKGLTPLGRQFIGNLMRKGAMIDIDHLGKKSTIDALSIAGRFSYPLVSGHTSLMTSYSPSDDRGRHEGQLDPGELRAIRNLGGYVSLNSVQPPSISSYARTVSGLSSTYPNRGTVSNDCGGSDKSWAQAYLNAVDQSRDTPGARDETAPGAVIGVGFGSDFNSFLRTGEPRFYHKQTGACGMNADAIHGSALLPSLLQAEAQGNPSNLYSGGDLNVGGNWGGVDTKQFPFGFPGANSSAGANGVLERSRLNENSGLFVAFNDNDMPMCLDTTGVEKNGTPPYIWDCGNNADPNQQWSFADGTIRPYVKNSSKCLDAPALGLTGQPVLWDCNGSPSQTWVLSTEGALHPEGDNQRCLEPEGVSVDNGVKIMVNWCQYPIPEKQSWTRGRTENFNYTGLSHIGLYPDFIRDLQFIGVSNSDLEPLFQSAEAYLQAWERANWYKPLDYSTLSSNTSWRWSINAPQGWQNPYFDDRGWDEAVDEGGVGTAPWGAIGNWPSSSPARWIWSYHSNDDWSAGTSTLYFRKEFVFDGKGDSATAITVTADNSFELYLNGTLAGSGNDWQVANGPFQITIPSKGRYVIAIKVTNAGGPSGLLVDVRSTPLETW